MGIEVRGFELGPFQVNTYVLSWEASAWVIDPSLDSEPLVDWLAGQRLDVQRILLTHGHGDHIAGIELLRKRWPGLKVVCPRGDAFMLPDPMANLSGAFGMALRVAPADELVEGGAILRGEGFELDVLDTAGHTPGGVSFLWREKGLVFTGDALFAGSIGRTDFPGSDHSRLIESIRRNLFSLDDATQILPGHGPASTIGQERRTNPFLQG